MSNGIFFGRDYTVDSFPYGEWMNRVKWYVRLFKQLNSYADILRSYEGYYWGAARTGAVVSVPNNAWTNIPLDSVFADGRGTGITSGGYLVPDDGFYMVSMRTTWAANPNGRRGCRVALDGTPVQWTSSYYSTVNNASNAVSSSVIQADKGQVMNLQGFQDSGGALNTFASFTHFSVRKLAVS